MMGLGLGLFGCVHYGCFRVRLELGMFGCVRVMMGLGLFGS